MAGDFNLQLFQEVLAEHHQEQLEQPRFPELQATYNTSFLVC